MRIPACLQAFIADQGADLVAQEKSFLLGGDHRSTSTLLGRCVVSQENEDGGLVRMTGGVAQGVMVSTAMTLIVGPFGQETTGKEGDPCLMVSSAMGSEEVVAASLPENLCAPTIDHVRVMVLGMEDQYEHQGVLQFTKSANDGVVEDAGLRENEGMPNMESNPVVDSGRHPTVVIPGI
ncbi:hypothetical protein NE237_022276 [Protea cynaroides]|uniref:Uncharacterized protein n=1 Tax=Protea cynaroides TaxID=273540 RepID=A0A9Q0HE33_9MAGN|nr:hypothetical protein NE237_022276 [Protea cynaroides]